MKKRLLSAFMALALCLTLLPTVAFAEGAAGGAASRTLGKSHCGQKRQAKSQRHECTQ